MEWGDNSAPPTPPGILRSFEIIIKFKETVSVKTKGIVLLGIIIILASVLICNANSGSELIGKWAEVGKPQNTLELFADNTVIAIEPAGAAEGKWSIMKDGRIKVVFTVGINKMSVGSIRGDILSLPGAGKYKKIK